MPRLRLPLLAATAAVAFLVPAIAVPATAGASAYPARPSGLRVTTVSHTGFTVGFRRAANARSYKLYVSTLKSDLYYANLTGGHASAARQVFGSRTPSVAAHSLTYRTVPYYYRVESLNGSLHAYSTAIGQLGLRPAQPTGVRVTSGASGTYLTWSSGAATGFRIQRADNTAMTLNVHTDRVAGLIRQFTPFGIALGRTYYYRIRAVNQSTLSAPTATLAVTSHTREQSARVMSYNILQTSGDNEREAGGVTSPWSQRRLPAAELIKSVNPDVVGVQEGQEFVRDGVRQVDDLHAALNSIGADYGLADTDANGPPTRAGSYILYKRSVYAPVGQGGHWSLGYERYWAAYQVLRNVNSGAEFLFVTTHLTTPGGLYYDRIRKAETETLVQDATAQAASAGGVPIVYTGDYNSNLRTKVHPLDGPGVVMRAGHVDDARLVAQSFTRGTYDSMNQYRRHPYHYSLDIDYVWAPPGVAATSYGTALKLKDGAFVGSIPSDHNPVFARVVFPY